MGIAALSLLPVHVKRAIGTTGVWHDSGHVAAFGITAILFLEWRRPGVSDLWRVWPVAAFAVTLEWLEAAIFGNLFEWRDIGSDSLGTIAALLVYGFCKLRLRRSYR